MKKRFTGAAIVATFAATALLVSACSATPDSGGGAPSTLVIDKSFDLVTADPGRMFETTGSIVLHGIYDSLLTFTDGDSSTPKPSVASSFEANDGATEYTFTLRDDVTFSDGTALTADDVVFSLNRVKNLQGNGSFLLDGLSVAKVDDHTVTISSETANTAIPAIVSSPTLGIVNKKAVEENGGTDAEGAIDSDKAEAFLNKTSAGSGPYILESFDTTTETVLVANPKYWGTAPAYEKIVFRNAAAETQLGDVQSGTAQVALDLGSDQLPALRSNPDIVISESSSPTFFFLFANANPAVSAITSNPDFREAVTYGLDYDGLLELAGDGAARANGVIPNMFLGALTKPTVERDVDRAKEAVARLGTIPSISLEYPNDISSNGLTFGPFAERIQANLAEVGITIELAPGPVATTLESYRAGTEQMGVWLWNPDYPDSADYLVFGPGGIVGLRAGWAAGTDPEIEALMAQVSTETDPAVRADLYVKYQELMNAAGVIIPLVQPSAAVVSTKTVGEVLYSPVYGGLDITTLK